MNKERKRVPKGENYWGVEVFQETVKTVRYTEDEGYYDGEAYNADNYFTDRDSAEQMASKIRAVLKGADVIEKSSEAEIYHGATKTTCNISISIEGVKCIKYKLVK